VLYRLQRRSNADDKLIFAVPDLVNFLGKIVKRYPASLSRDDGPLDRVPKLPHVARPIVRAERGQRFGVEAVNVLAMLLIELFNEVGDEQPITRLNCGRHSGSSAEAELEVDTCEPVVPPVSQP
jgi:hypothetical protein